jgi:methionyl-tRNA formyltransferase
MAIDLFLNHDIGLWALEKTPKQYINNVVTCNEEIFERAKEKGLNPIKDHNKLELFSKIGFSIHYPKIFKKEFIEKYEKIYNLHPSFLPWGKGRHTCFWALWHNEPAGATIHEIVEGLDKGPIVMQEIVSKIGVKNGYELYKKVEKVQQKLYKKCLINLIENIELSTKPQSVGGSYHREKEIYELKNKEFWEKLPYSERIKLYDCLDFPGYKNLDGFQKET